MILKLFIFYLLLLLLEAFVIKKSLLHHGNNLGPEIAICDKDQTPTLNEDRADFLTCLPSNSVENVGKEVGGAVTLASRQIQSSVGRKTPLTVRNLLSFFSGNYALNSFHEDRIVFLWKSLKNRGTIRHLDDFDNAKLMEALKVCYVALWDNTTEHTPFKVAIDRICGMASILGEMKAPVDVILSGLIYDVIAMLDKMKHSRSLMNINFIMEELSKRFGVDVIDLARDYNQLPTFSVKSKQYSISQAQTQMEMLISLMGNYYCLHLRLADRIYLLRELKTLSMNDSERAKIVQEARHVYAPLAHKMNLVKVKNELEDLSLKYLEPNYFIQCRMAQILASKVYEETFQKIKSLVSQDIFLSPHKDRIKFSYRIKGKYQVFQKMLRKNISSPLGIRDVLGIRMVVNPSFRKENVTDIELCYQLLHRVCHNLTNWQPVNSTFKDYIAYPKSNGYQSLHQCIRREGTNTSIEFQIRTKDMHLQAEVGAAAHWSYKDSVFRPNIASSRLYRATWRTPAQLQAHSAMEVIRFAQSYLRNNRVFVYLQDQSEVLNLKRSATALDAAFMIHSQIGLTVDRIFVNKGEKEIPKNAMLEDGQVLSVQTSDRLSILKQIEALSIVKTTHARQELRRYLKTHYPEAVVCLGLTQLMMIMANNFHLFEERIIYRRNGTDAAISDARVVNGSLEKKYVDMVFRFQHLVESRLGKTLDIFLQDIGLMNESKDLQLVFSTLFGVPTDRLLGIASLDLALSWVRKHLADVKSQKANDFLHHSLKSIVDIILPIRGYSSSVVWNIWNQVLGIVSHNYEEDLSKSLKEISSLGKLKYIAQVMRQIHNLKR